jgi:PTS system N-acetylgalactosamine-specific IIA component
MVGVILTGHGQFAPGLNSALEMVAGPQADFAVVPFDEAAAGDYGPLLRSAISDMRDKTDGVLVYVDLLGGTPFNQAMMAAQEIAGVEVVTGTNLPMLIETMLTRTADTTVDQMVATSLEVGRAGVNHKTISALEPEDGTDDEEGGI